MSTVRGVGVFVPQGWRMDLADIDDPVEQYEAMTRVGQEAERLGFDSLWLYDHFHTAPKPTIETTFECWTSTAGLARDTKTIRIGQMQKPHPPIWIGGSGEQVTRKLVAQYGDASNFGGGDLDAFTRKAAILRQHCETVGRDYNTITKSTNLLVYLREPGEVGRAEALTAPYRGGHPFAEWRKGNFAGTAEELLDICGQLQEAGADYLIFYAYESTKLDRVRRLGELLPKLRG